MTRKDNKQYIDGCFYCHKDKAWLGLIVSNYFLSVVPGRINLYYVLHESIFQAMVLISYEPFACHIALKIQYTIQSLCFIFSLDDLNE